MTSRLPRACRRRGVCLLAFLRSTLTPPIPGARGRWRRMMSARAVSRLAGTGPRNSRGRQQKLRQYLVSYSMIAPFYILYGVFGLVPLVFSLYLSLTRWDFISPIEFVGLANYVRLFTRDPLFRTACWNVLYIGVLGCLGEFLAALSLAFILDSPQVKGRHILRSAYFLPMLVSGVAMSLVFSQLFANRYGFVNNLLASLGLERVPWLGGDGRYVNLVIILMGIWQSAGWSMILITAGLQGIPRELYEAANIDGAGAFQVLTRITLPLLRPTLVYLVVMMVAGSIQYFEGPLIITGNLTGGPNNAGMTLSSLMFWNAFANAKAGYGAALGYVITVAVVVFSLASARLVGRGQG